MKKRQRRQSSILKMVNSLLLLACLGATALLFFTLKEKKILQSAKETSPTSTVTASSSPSNTENMAETVEWVRQEATINFPILMYHAIHVMDESEAASANLIVDPTTFDSHIKRLSDEGYYFLTPEEAYKVLTENVLPDANAKIIWLTFDDGDADFYSQAYPTLKKYKAKATNNIITSYVESGNPANLTINQMLEMKENGMSFQSHTVNHPSLEVTDEATQAQELSNSKAYLDEKLSQDTIALAYPSGRYSDTTLTLAQTNYQLAVTTNEGLASSDDGLLSLDRVRILPTTTADDLMNSITP